MSLPPLLKALQIMMQVKTDAAESMLGQEEKALDSSSSSSSDDSENEQGEEASAGLGQEESKVSNLRGAARRSSPTKGGGSKWRGRMILNKLRTALPLAVRKQRRQPPMQAFVVAATNESSPAPPSRHPAMDRQRPSDVMLLPLGGAATGPSGRLLKRMVLAENDFQYSPLSYAAAACKASFYRLPDCDPEVIGIRSRMKRRKKDEYEPQEQYWSMLEAATELLECLLLALPSEEERLSALRRQDALGWSPLHHAAKYVVPPRSVSVLLFTQRCQIRLARSP